MKKDVYIIIGTAYLEEDEALVKNKYIKKSTSVSNTVFERKLFQGFLENGATTLFVSSPSLGYFPTSLKRMRINNLTSKDSFYNVPYNALIGYSPISKKNALIKKIKSLIKRLDSNARIHLILCEAHKPYLDVAKFFKSKQIIDDVTIFVPDMPEHNIRSKNRIYKYLKNKNVKAIYKEIDDYVDNFVFFSKPMIEKFNLEGKKYIVNEGISNGIHFNGKCGDVDGKKHIVFIGKLDERNGINLIYEVASKINDPSVIFDLYGIGGTVLDEAGKNNMCDNIFQHGFVQPCDVQKILSESTILLSPRFSNQEYTKYSFPSKIFDYIESFKPIITFKLECYPNGFENVVFYPKKETAEELLFAIKEVLKKETLDEERMNNYKKFIKKYNKKSVALSVIDLIEK